MKKFICGLCILFFGTSLLAGCGDNKVSGISEKSVRAKDSTISKKVTEKADLYTISVDPKVELLCVVQYLADDQNIVKISTDNQIIDYSYDITKYFGKYKNEPVIKLYKQMNEKDFAYDTPSRLILYVDDKFNLSKDIPLPRDIIQNAGGEDSIKMFLKELKDFNEKSGFSKFYNAHTGFYYKLASQMRERLDKTGCISKVVNYYGLRQDSYNIIIEPLSNSGYAAWLPDKNEKSNLYAFVSPCSSDEIDLTNLIIHEFGHSYVNPLTERYMTSVDKLSYLFAPIKDKQQMQPYQEWSFCVNEHLVRAITYRILFDIYGSKISQEYLKRDNNAGFIYIDNLYEKLDDYEKNRDKYQMFSDFYPELLNGFK